MNCPECGTPCKDGACMKCGIVFDSTAAAAARQKQAERDAAMMTKCFYALVPLVVTGVIFFLAKTPGCSSSAPAARPGSFIVQPNTFGCKTLEDYKRLSGLAGDLPAFERSMRESVLKGTCLWLPVGKKASLEDYKMAADAAKVRVQGDSQSYWVPGKSAK